jgi:O-antigen ligase
MITQQYVQSNKPLREWFVSDKAVLAVAVIALFASFWSKFLISLSILLFVLLAIPHIVSCIKRLRSSSRRPVLYTLSLPFRDIVCGSLILIFLGTSISALLSETTQDIHKVQLRLPYLLLPFAFYFLPVISQNSIKIFLKIYIPMALLFAIGVLINYSQNMAHYDELIAMGQSMPVPGNHIRFSLLLAAAVAFGTISLTESIIPLKSKWGYFMLLMLILLFCCIHVIAVRSGLLTMYGALFLIFIRFFYRRKKFLQLIAVGAGMIVVLFVATQFIPSLEARFNYMVHDIQLLTEKDVGNYSDGDRFRSIYIGWRVFIDSPMLGSGICDLPQEITTEYSSVYDPSVPVRIPHNQFIYILASMGLLGVITIFPGLFIPFFKKFLRSNPFIIIHGAMYLASCMIEPTMEGTQGVMFHLLFLLLFINSVEKEMEKREGRLQGSLGPAI